MCVRVLERHRNFMMHFFTIAKITATDNKSLLINLCFY